MTQSSTTVNSSSYPWDDIAELSRARRIVRLRHACVVYFLIVFWCLTLFWTLYGPIKANYPWDAARSQILRSTLPILFLGLFVLGIWNDYRRRWHSRHGDGPDPIAGVDCSSGQAIFFSYGGDRIFPRRQTRLRKMLLSPSEKRRRRGIEGLVALGPKVLSMLFYYSRIENEDYRQAILEVIDRVHPEGLLPALIEGLELLDPHSQWQICKILRDMGPAAATAVPALLERTKQGPTPAASDAYEALQSIAPDQLPNDFNGPD